MMEGGDGGPGAPRRPRRASAYKQWFNLGGLKLDKLGSLKLGDFKLGAPRHWRPLVALGLLVAVLVGGGMFTYVLLTLRYMPDPGRKPSFPNSITIYDRDRK